MICHYCHQNANLVSGDVIYPHRPDLFHKKFWQCNPCRAFVGCHDANIGYGDGTRPLGILANAQLRKAKKSAHYAFDPLWRGQNMTRKEAYVWLAKQLNIPVNQCHIGMMNLDMCTRTVEVISNFMNLK